MEVWKDVKGFEGVYQVSNRGRLKSLPRQFTRSNGFIMTIKKRILKTYINTNGYECGAFQNGKRTKPVRVHRLVALHHIPNPHNKYAVNHIDGHKTNNNASNLEWVTKSENEKHAHSIGLKDGKGEKHSQSKLTNKDVIYIRTQKGKQTSRCLANKYNVGYSAIISIWNRRTWKHV